MGFSIGIVKWLIHFWNCNHTKSTCIHYYNSQNLCKNLLCGKVCCIGVMICASYELVQSHEFVSVGPAHVARFALFNFDSYVHWFCGTVSLISFAYIWHFLWTCHCRLSTQSPYWEHNAMVISCGFILWFLQPALCFCAPLKQNSQMCCSHISHVF